MRCDLERIDPEHLQCKRPECQQIVRTTTRPDSVSYPCKVPTPEGYTPPLSSYGGLWAPIEAKLDGARQEILNRSKTEQEADESLDRLDAHWGKCKVCPEIENWICKRVPGIWNVSDCARRTEWVGVIIAGSCDRFSTG
jgi:hypothetical protein